MKMCNDVVWVILNWNVSNLVRTDHQAFNALCIKCLANDADNEKKINDKEMHWSAQFDYINAL